MASIRYIALNPKKCRKFITKGINLNFKNPIASFPSDLEPEFMMRINTAIAEGKVFELDSNAAALHIPGQAAFDFESDHDSEDSGDVVGKKVVKEIVEEDGTKKKVHIIQFFGDENTKNKDTEQKIITPTIIGNVVDEHDED